MRQTVSIIIPALDEEKVIASTLSRLAEVEGEFEVVVVDGGSRDRTREIAREKARDFSRLLVIESARGRGPQMNEGARAATGDVLVFLHADTRLPPDAVRQIESATRDPGTVGGNFHLIFDGGRLSSRLFTLIYNARTRFGIYYGDSAIWVRRDVFDRIGGFIAAPVMEDYDFCRKLERAGATRKLPGPVLSSSRRWSGGRTLFTVCVWVLIQSLFMLGVSPHRLAWIYYPKSFKFRDSRSARD
jgi:rSAM/selenodomain-associated transferase 2